MLASLFLKAGVNLPEWRNILAGQERKRRPRPWGAFHSEEMRGQDIKLKKSWKAPCVGCIGANGAESRVGLMAE